MKRQGFTLTETLIIGALFGLFVVAGTLLLGTERARTRDMKRVADMTRFSSAFSALYAQKASYLDAAAGCAKVGTLASSCTLASSLPGLDRLEDPGGYSYLIAQVPTRDSFAIKFRLERRYGTLNAGWHTLTPTGIH